ncbi:MAG: tRNA epoxyqueuosine(34) reductase QueG [Fidelibacterota bacterium]
MITGKQIESIMTRKFTAFGISKPSLDSKYISRYRSWLEKGYYADMSWMVKSAADRFDIRRKFPWVKAILVGLDNYYSPPFFTKSGLRFSGYALGIDYHVLVKEKLETALVQIRNVDPDVRGRVYVDTGSFMEKAYAEQAGLGWIAKNGLFIAENIGSYCFIGIILLSIELPVTGSAVNRCGSCRKCLESCPTGAIVAPGMIDARRCISYLTVEKRGVFSEQEAEWLNGWVYGCDVCQEVCPWNIRWQKVTSDERYTDNRTKICRLLEFGNGINMDKFKAVFKNSAVKRLKFENWIRNIDTVFRNAPGH